MLNSKKSAEHIRDILLKCSADINESVRYVQENCSEEEFKIYRRAMGNILGEIYDEGFVPLFKKHPELEPENFKE